MIKLKVFAQAIKLAWLMSNWGLIPACTQPTNVLTDGNFAYHLDEPAQRWKLNKDLDEISGLAYVDGATLAAVDDEEDAIFFYDLEEGEIIGQLDLGKKEDYEGVERVGETYYALRSDGLLIQTDGLSLEEHPTELSEKNDTEGLGYDAANRSLLIACKEDGRIKGQKESMEVLVYRYSISSQQLTPFLYYSGALLNGKRRFKVSAIAQHPKTQHFYLLSSADHSLAILDNESQVVSLAHLSRSTFPQPEGICFAPDGTLYISNEGRSGQATILQFTMSSG